TPVAAPEPPKPAPAPEPEAPAAYAHPLEGPLVLEDLEAFADLPDDAREELAKVATISTLGKDEEVGGFALAFVMNGEVDVAATIVDAPAARLHAGAVLRTRGTVGEGMALRLIGTDAEARVATWAPEAVEAAFKTTPWVEDDLRAAADRMQAMVGITMGQIADRLDASLRQSLVDRLEVKTLGPGDVLVAKGKPLPGLILLGVGAIEVVDGEDVRGEIGPGDFLFATEILGGGAAPATARAGAEGAVYLFADRKVAQEMLVTVPPLLEIFAGM
ncbi:MAG TPA: cyclic nucleotide-binding domain-containing protein, partial [Polyangiaceae bacterium]